MIRYDRAGRTYSLTRQPDPRIGAVIEQALRDMATVANILTWDDTIFRQFWLLREYLPAVADTDARLAVPISTLISLLGTASIQTVPVPHDCVDGFGGAYWRRPGAYLEETVRAGMSMFALTPKALLTNGLERLSADLANGAWERRHADLLETPELDLGYRLLVSDLRPESPRSPRR